MIEGFRFNEILHFDGLITQFEDSWSAFSPESFISLSPLRFLFLDFLLLHFHRLVHLEIEIVPANAIPLHKENICWWYFLMVGHFLRGCQELVGVQGQFLIFRVKGGIILMWS